MATVGATLFGLIFVAISIAPEITTGTSAPVDRQIRATAAYVALLNPTMISLFALVPYQLLTIAVSALSWVGIFNTVAMSVTLLRSKETTGRVLNWFLIILSLILYGFEAFVAVQLEHTVLDNVWLSLLADLMIFITLFGIVRAWELIGVRQYRIRDWLENLVEKKFKRVENKPHDKGIDDTKP